MRSRGGFALMASLWLMVAIAAVSLQISSSARNHRLAAANMLEDQRARAAAVSGVEHARARLVRIVDEGGDRKSWRDPQRLVDPWYALDTLLASQLDAARYEVRLHDAGGRLNVNVATDGDLRRYFSALNIDAARVEALVQSIADWKDADDVRRPQGAESAEYLRAGARELPRNGPFTRVEELAAVAGMTAELLQRAIGDLTTLGTGQVNVNSASRAVLLSLPGFTDAAAQAVVRERVARRRIGSWNDLVNLVPREGRPPLEAASAELLARLVYQTREVVVESTGTVDGSPVTTTIDALLVRAGSTVFVTWSVAR